MMSKHLLMADKNKNKLISVCDELIIDIIDKKCN